MTQLILPLAFWSLIDFEAANATIGPTPKAIVNANLLKE